MTRDLGIQLPSIRRSKQGICEKKDETFFVLKTQTYVVLDLRYSFCINELRLISKYVQLNNMMMSCSYLILLLLSLPICSL
jgi:hypothetical protein